MADPDAPYIENEREQRYTVSGWSVVEGTEQVAVFATRAAAREYLVLREDQRLYPQKQEQNDE